MDAVAQALQALREFGDNAHTNLAAAARERADMLLTHQQNLSMQQMAARKAGESIAAAKKTDTTGVTNNALLDDAEDEESAEAREAARYKQYKPQQLEGGKPHPDIIVESGALAAVKQPQIWADYSSLMDDVHAGRISDAQLETVAYSLQRFYGERLEGGARGGFFLGDGAGVGKGRQIAAVIKAMWENRGHKTRRILWLSHNKDLREDARRDMMDLHINVPSASKRSAVARPRIDVWPRGNQSFPQKSRAIKEYLKEGVVFATYDLLKAGTKGVRKECTTIRGKDKADQAYDTMVSALSKPNARCQQIIEWLKEDPDEVPLIVLDECHKAKNLINDQGVPTLCGVAVQHLQAMLPNAAVLYSSATGISEPNNMAYMTRVGACGYASMVELIQQLGKAGLGASELFSCTLKSNGVYLARQLSYEGAEFQLDMIQLEPRFQVQYSRAAATWQAFNLFWHRTEVFGRAVKDGKLQRGIATLFWGAQLRFFRSMLMAAKVPALAVEARAAIEADCAVVIGLQSTGEANQRAEVEANGETMEDLFSAPTTQLKKLVKQLTNAPAVDAGAGHIQMALTESVAMMVCLGEVLLKGGTVAKEAETLAAELKAAAAAEAAARAKRAEVKHKAKAARAAVRGGGAAEGAADLEDSDVESGDEGEASGAPQRAGALPCRALSKIMLDFAREHEGEGGDAAIWVAALKSLQGGNASYGSTDSWGANQATCERALIDLHGKLVAEQRRREHDRRAIHDVEVRRVAAQAVADAQAEFDAAKAERAAFEAAVVRKPGAAAPKLLEPSTSVASGATAASTATRRLRAAAEGLEDSDAEDDEKELSDHGLDTEEDEEDEDVVITSPAPGGPRRRSARAATARPPQGVQIVLSLDDSDEEDGGAAAAEPDGDFAMEGSDGEGVASASARDTALKWPEEARRGRRSRSRSTAGGSPEPADRTSEATSPLQWRGRKRGSGEMQSARDPAALARAAQRLRLDYEAAAAAEGLTVAEVERIAALEQAVPPPTTDLEDIACQVCDSIEDADTMLLCDFCQRGIHMACHSPPLAEVPEDEGDWHCPKCASDAPKHATAQRLRDAHASARRRAGVSEADMEAAVAALLAGETPQDDVPAGGEEGPGPAKAARTNAASANTIDMADDPADEAAAASEGDKAAGAGKPAEQEEKPKDGVITKVTVATSKPDAATDMEAATQGGAISASAALSLLRKKSKKKKDKRPDPAPVADAPAPAAAAMDVAPADEAGPSDAVAAPAAAVALDDDDDEDDEAEPEEEKFVEGTIRATSRRRHLELRLDKAARALREAKQNDKTARRARSSGDGAMEIDGDDVDGASEGAVASGSRGRRAPARRAASSGGGSSRGGGSTKRRRSPDGSDSDFSAGGDEDDDDEDDDADEVLDAGALEDGDDEDFGGDEAVDDDAMQVDGGEDEDPGQAIWRRQKMELSAQPYDFEKMVWDSTHTRKLRAPHPVVMMLKRVISLVIELLELPPNPLDDLVHRCGGRKVVAELTGRHDMMEMQADGQFRSVKRAEQGVVKQNELNMHEKKAFMDGKKLIAIISDAASTGISLQADKKCKNQRRRIHMTLELPWSADKAIQQFGRSHRSNQASAPIYKILMTRMCGEYRFAASAAKRMMSLGALLKGNRDALGAGQSLKAFDVDNEYGQKGLRQFWAEVRGGKQIAGEKDEKTHKIKPVIPVPEVPDYLQCPDELPVNSVFDSYDDRTRDFFRCVRTWLVQCGAIDRLSLHANSAYEKIAARTPSAFMNKFLMLNGDQQDLVFRYFQACSDAQVALAKSRGLYTTGVQFVGEVGHQMSREAVWTHPQPSKGAVYLTRVQIEMGLTYDAATELVDSNLKMMEEYGSRIKQSEVGFWVRKEPKNRYGTSKDFICLVTGMIKQNNDGQAHMDKKVLQRYPWSRNAGRLQLLDLRHHWKPCTNEKSAKALWTHWYNFFETRCGHLEQPCDEKRKNGTCSYHTRKQTIHVLHGSLLPCWQTLLDTTISCSLDHHMQEDDDGNVTVTTKKKSGTKGDIIQMVCLKLANGETVTGMSVRTDALQPIRDALRVHEQELKEKMRREGILTAERMPAGSAATARAIAAEVQADMAGAGPSARPLQPVKPEKKRKSKLGGPRKQASPGSVENVTPPVATVEVKPDVKPPVATAADTKARASMVTDNGLMSAERKAEIKARKAAKRAAASGGV